MEEVQGLEVWRIGGGARRKAQGTRYKAQGTRRYGLTDRHYLTTPYISYCHVDWIEEKRRHLRARNGHCHKEEISKGYRKGKGMEVWRRVKVWRSGGLEKVEGTRRKVLGGTD